MATKITDRAFIVAQGTIAKNNCGYVVYADTQVGQRIKAIQPNRYWLILKPANGHPVIRQSTQKEAVYAEWMQLIAENGAPA